MYSILLTEIPKAKVYHALCTGYAGLFLARARLEADRPCMLTEHGIYTNERRIEITAAQWLDGQKSMSLDISRPHHARDLKDYWSDTFSSYSKLCYDACQEIVTLYEGNKDFQISDGADPTKIRIIPNGVDFDRFSGIKKEQNTPPTVALIGRVVPIKDIKTFIHAVRQLRERIPNIRGWILGPTNEDEGYYKECLALLEKYQLNDSLTFAGKVDIDDYLNQIDVLVLTSISEAQPLVILECGAVGIPCVATDVGACRELVYGRGDEDPPLGQAGEVCPLTNPNFVADSIHRLITEKKHYESCSKVIRERVKKYYFKKDQDLAYKTIYASLIANSKLQNTN